MELVSRRQEVAFVGEWFDLSERRACELIGVERSSYRYCRRPERGVELREQLRELARKKPRYGYRRLTVLLRRAGHRVNHKRVWRWCRVWGLAVGRRKRKRLRRVAPPQNRLVAANQEWAMDFVSDSLASGRPLRALTLIDGYTRECLEIEVATSLGSRRVARALERVMEQRGLPGRIRLDNGPEFTSRYFQGWCADKQVRLMHIQPGKPVQNATVESFNGRFRDECLNAEWFGNLEQARRTIRGWKEEYNQWRPHSALGYRTPLEFAAHAEAPAQAALTGRPSGAAWASASACASLAPGTGELHL